MEISKQQIAKLVLGYLKSEKCHTAYEEFIKSSECLKSQATLFGKRKVFVTRVAGKCLEEILEEYAQMVTIVQGLLEQTNYYKENKDPTSIIKQFLYLLEKESSIPSSAVPSPISVNDGESHASECETHFCLNATPTESLPGNAKDEITPKNSNILSKSQSASKSTQTKDENADISGILAQTLLENNELHVKLAETINTVRNSSDTGEKLSVSVQEGVSQELDATIKTIVQKTEEDPIFDKILDEIIGKPVDVFPTTDCSHNVSLSFKASNNSHNSSNKYNKSANSSLKEDDLKSSSNKIKDSVPKSNEVIIFDGTLDNYLKSSNAMAPLTNQLYVSTGGVLVMPTVPANISTVACQPSKYFLVNNQPLLTSVPSKSSTVLTEQDILKMPTIIINEDVGNPSVSTSSTTAQTNYVNATADITNITTSSAVTESTAMHTQTQISQMRTMDSLITPPAHNSTPKERRRKKVFSRKIPKEPAVLKELRPKVDEKSDVGKQRPESPTDKEKPPAVLNKKLDLLPKEKEFDNSLITPIDKESLITRDPTPKSGSHVRNLDFSTPEKKIGSPTKEQDFDKTRKVGASKSLFNSEAKKQKKGEIRKISPMFRAWDSDLRALATNSDTVKENEESLGVKRKKNGAKTRSKAKEEEAADLKDEAKTLEAALKTPAKADVAPTRQDKVVDETIISKDEEKVTVITIEESSTEQEEAVKNAIFSLRNCNGAPRIKRKCNVTNTKKESENLKEDKSKLILSPSKLNANKRHLVNENEEKILPDIDETEDFEPKAVIQETPIKNINNIPKTPGVLTPGQMYGFTPFNKVLEEQLVGVDLTSLSTPCLPITPSFPITPSADLISPYSNRPTDYSTSSSYYQPSDTEQNKSLEQIMLEECKRLEKPEKSITILSDVRLTMQSIEEETITKSDAANIADHKKVFNRHVIGKKNLNLVNRRVSLSSTSSDDSSDNSSSNSSSCSDSESSDLLECSTNTVICNKVEPTTPYSLRKRYTNATTPNNTDSVKNMLSNVDDKAKSTLEENKRASLLAEMENKRRRTIACLKNRELERMREKTPSAEDKSKKKPAAKEEKKPSKKLLVNKGKDPPMEEKKRSREKTKALTEKTNPPEEHKTPSSEKLLVKEKKYATEDNKPLNLANKPSPSSTEETVTASEKMPIDEAINKSKKVLREKNGRFPKGGGTSKEKAVQRRKSPRLNVEVGVSFPKIRLDGAKKKERRRLPIISSDEEEPDIEPPIKRPRRYNERKNTTSKCEEEKAEDQELETSRKNQENKHVDNQTTQKQESLVTEESSARKSPHKSMGNQTTTDEIPQAKIENDTLKCKSVVKLKSSSHKGKTQILDKAEVKPESKSAKSSSVKEVVPNSSELPAASNVKKPKRAEILSEPEKMLEAPKTHAKTVSVPINRVDENATITCPGETSGVQTTNTGNKPEECDREAEKLVNDLKERGIHLVPNKSPKKIYSDRNLGNDKSVENAETLKTAKAIECKESADTILVRFNIVTFEDENLRIEHDGKGGKFEDYDLNLLKKDINANVYLEAANAEVQRLIKWTPFVTLLGSSEDGKLELPMSSSSFTSSEESVERNLSSGDDELMNYAIIGSVREENPDEVASPKSSRKRKGSILEDSQVEKRSKPDKCQELLKKIDVDLFLNKLHGSS